MKKTNFKIDINASKEKVWNVLWNDDTYTQWTAPFGEGSYAQTDWKEGSKVLFLSSNGEGMNSTIVKKTPNEFMSFKHLGMIKDGIEMPLDDKTREWSGAMENYILNEKGGGTELVVEMDIAENFEKYFTDTFPKALEKVKELAEKIN
ncbi:MAG: SRPBCC domain-containing protein [Ferruginibacter sp.]